MTVRSVQADRKPFSRFGGTALGGPNAAKRTMLRPAPGTEAVSRFIASPFEALPGPFRFAHAGATVGNVLPDGVTEPMRIG